MACFLAEQAAQLRVKAAFYKLLGESPRGHQIRSLLGELAMVVGGDCAERIKGFVRSHRAQLSELEDAYLMSRYGFKTYTRKDASDMIGLVEEVFRLVEEAEGGCSGA